jgi:hypothetical protein
LTLAGEVTKEIVIDRPRRNRDRQDRVVDAAIARREILADEERRRVAILQTETLPALQEAARDYIRANVEMHLEDKRQLQISGTWTRGPFSDELNRREFDLRSRLWVLKARVSDETLRRLIDRCLAASVTITQATSVKDQERSIWEVVAPLGEEINVRVGELLRAAGDGHA